MAYIVRIETATPRLIAAVRRQVRIGEIAGAWKPALDEVWAFLGRHPGLAGPNGHNVFLYHHPTRREDPMDIDFGVEVSRPFLGEGAISMVPTPAGEVATTLHVGPYAQLPEAHRAIHTWCATNGKRIGGKSWEIYGDWNEDETKLETEVVYSLA
ncbi:MAG TPA: GyrI-like domain-containing protein [Caulobacterales bacterium]|nr:GyrI-like domain-containing protein [Caulobacterales bacterium]